MSENKSEIPTRQRLKKARRQGEVAKSSFLAGALLFTGGILFIAAFRSLFASGFQKSMRTAFERLLKPEIEGAFWASVTPLILPLALTFLALFVLALAAHLLQTGWVWSLKRKRGKGERRLALPLLNLAVIVGMGYLALHSPLKPTLLVESPAQQALFILKKCLSLSLKIGILLLLLGFFDLLYQKWRFYKRMHMTPKEKKQELRESEGNQKVKSHRRR